MTLLPRKARSARSSVVVQSASIVGASLIAFLLSVIVARSLGPERFGAFAFVLSIATAASTFQDGGFRALLFREAASVSHALMDFRKTVFGASTTHVVVVTMALVIALSLCFPNTSIGWAAVATGCVVLQQQISARMKGTGLFWEEGAWAVITRLVALTAVVAVIYATDGITVRDVFIALTFSGALTVAWAVYRGWLELGPVAPWAVYRAALPLLLIDLCTNVYTRAGLWALETHNLGAESIASYAVGSRLVEGVLLGAAPVAQVLAQRYRSSDEKNRTVQDALRRGVFILLSLAILGIALFWLGSSSIVPLIFGSDYSSAIQATKFISISLLFSCPNYLLTQLTIAANGERWYVVTATLSAVVALLVAFLAVPHFGLAGAAAGLIVAEATQSLLLGGWLMRRSEGQKSLRRE